MQRTNPQSPNSTVGAGHVDHYIGSSFDVVYEVYKRLQDFPVLLDFIINYVPRIGDIEETNEDILARYESITTMSQETEAFAEQVASDKVTVGIQTENLEEAVIAAEAARDITTEAQDIVLGGFLEFPQQYGYVYKGSYAEGVELNAFNEYLVTEIGYYVANPNNEFPVVMSGSWQFDEPRLKSLGDEYLRTAVDETKVSKTTQILSGDGISGGGTLEQDVTINVDDTVIRTEGSQNIIGTKTFSASPNVPYPNYPQNAANRAYVIDGLNAKANKETKITAGFGLVGSGTLENDITLDVNFGAGINQVVQGNDPRLSGNVKEIILANANTEHNGAKLVGFSGGTVHDKLVELGGLAYNLGNQVTALEARLAAAELRISTLETPA